jgi:RNA polymerase I-specific transcription initiation factor RRN7
VEVYVYAEKLVSLLRLDFSFPTKASVPLNNPEMLLVASIVLATRLLYPFDREESLSGMRDHRAGPGRLRIDWANWAWAFENKKPERHDRRDFEMMTSADVYDMAGEDMDKYMDWYQESKITPREGWLVTVPFLQRTRTNKLAQNFGTQNVSSLSFSLLRHHPPRETWKIKMQM